MRCIEWLKNQPSVHCATVSKNVIHELTRQYLDMSQRYVLASHGNKSNCMTVFRCRMTIRRHLIDTDTDIY